MTVCKESWSEEAYAALRRWARKDAKRPNIRKIRGTHYYTTVAGKNIEAIRQELRLDPPGDLRWFGPVVQRLIRQGHLRGDGYAPAKSSHGAMRRTYRGHNPNA